MGLKKLQQQITSSKGIIEKSGANDFAFRFYNLKAFIPDDKTQTIEIGEFENNYISADFKKPVELNCIVLRENMSKGQRVEQFEIQILDTDNKSFFIKGTTIGNKRILTFSKIKIQLVILRIQKSNGNPRLHPFDFFMIDENLVEKN